jgi:hypothetical protein
LVTSTAKGTRVLVGITGTCPYGIGSCWGGAYEALGRLQDVDLVSPIPDAEDSTAQVFLTHDGLPALDTWDQQFHQIVNGTYELRGVEVTLIGSILERDGQYSLTPTDHRPSILLHPLAEAEKIQWNHRTRTPKPPSDDEYRAFEKLIRAEGNGMDRKPVAISGRLTLSDGDYHFYVRALEQ